jgi:hypothetical protein
MADLTTLEARIQVLEDIEAIKRLKYRYWRCLDLKRWDELAGCFTPDATVDYSEGKYRFQGVEAIIGFLSKSLGWASGSIGSHHGHHPEIELTSPTTARAVWALDNYLFNPGQQRNVRIAAFYEDDCVKVNGAWKLRHVGYTYVYHEEWSRADTPSLRLIARAEAPST